MNGNTLFARLSAKVESSFVRDRMNDLAAVLGDASEPDGLSSLAVRDHVELADVQRGSDLRDEYVRQMLLDLRAYQRDCRAQARLSFFVATLVAPVACAGIIAGLAFYSANMPPSAIVSWVCSAAFSGAAPLLLRIYRNESRRADEVMRDLREIEKQWLSDQLLLQAGDKDSQTRGSVARKAIERARGNLQRGSD